MTKKLKFILISLAGLILLGIFLLQIPFIRNKLEWRYEVWATRFKNTINPVGAMPTPIPSTPFATFTPLPPTSTPIAEASPTITPTVIPLPLQVSLPSPTHEKQGINNCGPAVLSMTLQMYGWEGDQYEIANIVKPIDKDRNVNPEELRYFVLNEAGWLQAEYRVGGNIDLLKRLLAANYPVIIEEASKVEPEWANGPRDDLWDAHYLLINGYDDEEGVFTVQDSQFVGEIGANKKISYDTLMKDWKPFNYLFMVIYFPQDEAEVQSILGTLWDENQSRRIAMELANFDIAANPKDAFAWFNLGASLTYFGRYEEAAQAFDQAFTIGLPQRMTRYQFWPFKAYFETGQIDYLLEITENTYTLINGYYSEEALLWHGWGLYRKGDLTGAIADWRKALKVHPGYADALYALSFVGATP